MFAETYPTTSASKELSSVTNEFSANPGKIPMRPLSLSEVSNARSALEGSPNSPSKRLLERKLSLPPRTRLVTPAPVSGPTFSAADLISNVRTPSIRDAADYAFLPSTIPYEQSFASRLYGFVGATGPSTASSHDKRNLLYRDWGNKTPWMELLQDIHDHYSFKGETIDSTLYTAAPIDYVGLQQWHLNQVHDLLETVFWPGIDVTTALEYSPETYTVVAMYKRLVVGIALISPPPDEAYITYLAVKSGWENSGIAHVMLYLLITGSPDRDIILHVSANNPAMLLYNKFGFKAEEFVAGFYEDYLDPKSKACRNALRLRLRQR